MRKAAGKVVRISLFLLVVVFALLVAAPFFIDANQYKSLIVDQAEKATGRHIEIGTLQASLFPWVGVTLEDVRIANPKGFAKGDLLQIRTLDVQIAVMPLLGGQYQIERFVLDAPRLQLVRAADGFSNWEDLLPSSSSPEKPAASSRPPAAARGAPASAGSKAPETPGALAALTARSLRMSDGEIHYTDQTSDTTIDLTALNIAIDDVQMQRPVSLNVSGKLDGNAFALDGMIGPLGDLAALNAAKLPLKGHVNVPGADLARLSRLVEGLKVLGNGTMALDMQFEQRPNGVRVMAGSMKLHRLPDVADDPEGRGAPAGFNAGAHDVVLDVKAQMPDARRMQIERLGASLDGNRLLDVNGTLTGIGATPRYQLRINTPELTRQQLARWVPQLQAMYAAHPSPWSKLKLGMLIAGDTGAVDIRDLQLLLDGELVQVSGNVGFAGAPDIRLRIASRQLHLDPWLPQPGEQIQAATLVSPEQKTLVALPSPAPAGAAQPAVSGSVAAAGKPGAEASVVTPPSAQAHTRVQLSTESVVEPDLRFLKPWKTAVVMQVDRMWLRGLEISRLRADVNGRKGIIKLSPLRFELAGGRVEENASIHAAFYPARWTESVKIRDVQVQPILMALAGNNMLSGSLQMDTNLSSHGLLPEAAMAGLKGNGNVLLRDGSIKGFDIAGTLRTLRRFGQPANGPKKTDFSQLSGSFNMTGGVARNDDLFVASPLFRLTGYGRVNLKDRVMDYHLKPRLVGTLVGQGDSEAVRKGLEVPLRLIGPLDDPQVKLEVSLESLLGNREAIRDVVKDPKAALKDLIGGSLPGRTPADQPSKQGQSSGQPAAQPKPLEQLLNRVLPGQQQQPADQNQQQQQNQQQKPLDQLLNQVLPGF